LPADAGAASLLRILAADKTSFSCVLRTRPENDIGSGLQPLLAPRMSLLRI